MALAERALASNTADTGTTGGVQTISVTPTGMQQDDWLIFLLVSNGGTAAHSNTAGGVSRLHAADTASGTAFFVSTWKKKCDAGEAGPYTFQVFTSNRRAALGCLCYSGGDATDIIDTAVAFVDPGANQSAVTITGATPGDTGRVHLLLTVFGSSAGAALANVPSWPTNYAEKLDFTSANVTLSNAAQAWGSRALPDANATGNQTVTLSVAVGRLMGASVLLKPAAGGATVNGEATQHAHTAATVTLTQVHNLAVASAQHVQTAASPTLDQSIAGYATGYEGGFGSVAPTLTVQNATHTHTATTVALTQVHVLTVAAASSAHTAEAATLTQVHQLAAQDAQHAQTAATTALTQVHALVVADVSHGHAAENVILSLPVSAPTLFVVRSSRVLA
jgi:hypothetical protein